MSELREPHRYEHGLIIVLPGIEGQSSLNRNIARGLNDAGIPAAIEIYDWSSGFPLAKLLIDLTAERRNRRHARKLAQHIQRYRYRFPHRPVHLIGHSGGGGLAVYALEALPAEEPIESALLLAPALSQEYNLSRALRRTKYGIWNFYSRADVGFLRVGTTIFGTIDREHGTAAGAAGFKRPGYLSFASTELYRTKLHQVQYTRRMAQSGNLGGHTGWASRRFARDWLAPLVYSQMESPPSFAAEPPPHAGRAPPPSQDPDARLDAQPAGP
jgi:pimeloyl-ACP methyl ester carboxylesterase